MLHKRAYEILKNEGISSFVISTTEFMKNHIRSAYLSAYFYIWNNHSLPLPLLTTEYRVDSITGEFCVTTYNELDRLQSTTEKPVMNDLLSNIQPDDVFYDIGANIGRFSCLAAKQLNSGRVIAIEPLPSNVESLTRNIKLCEVSNRVDVRDVVFSDETGEAELDILRSSKAGEGMSRLSGSSSTNNTIQVESWRGDEFIAENELPSPTVVKIDVEGAELKVIEGMSDELASEECRLVYCEIHHDDREESQGANIADFGGSPQQLKEKLREMGYEIETLVHRNTPVPKGHIIRAVKTRRKDGG